MFRVNVVNFNLIHSQRQNQKQINSDRFYKTVRDSTLWGMATDERQKSVAACFRNHRKDLFIDKKIAFDHFRELCKKY